MKKVFPWIVTLFVVVLTGGIIAACMFLTVPYWLIAVTATIVGICGIYLLVRLLVPYIQHDYGGFSHLIWTVRRVQDGKKTLNDEEAGKVEESLLHWAEKHPELEAEACRYAGDLRFAREDSRGAESFYQRALRTAVPDSENELYLQHRLALCHFRGGKDRDAFREFEALAARSLFFTIGHAAMVEFGWCTDPDPEKARELYWQSYLAGNESAMANIMELEWFLEHGADKTARMEYEGYMRCCHNGRGLRAGVPSLRRAAQAGYVPAQFELGTLYMEGQAGDSLRQRRTDGMEWLRKAANAGYAPALYNLGTYSQVLCIHPETGKSCQPVIPGTRLYKNEDRKNCALEGHRLIQKAAENGYIPAMLSLGNRYLIGDGYGRKEIFRPDRVMARIWFSRAAEAGSPKAVEILKKLG